MSEESSKPKDEPKKEIAGLPADALSQLGQPPAAPSAGLSPDYIEELLKNLGMTSGITVTPQNVGEMAEKALDEIRWIQTQFKEIRHQHQNMKQELTQMAAARAEESE